MNHTQVTHDYSIFKKHEKNRELVGSNLRYLRHSLQQANMLQLFPLLVNKNMEILDGQHRLEVAKELDIPVYYQIKEDSEDREIILLNANQKPWVLVDYVNYYYKDGSAEYRRIMEFSQKHQLKINVVLQIYTKLVAKCNKKIKDGNFVFFNEKQLSVAEDAIYYSEIIIERLKQFVITAKNFLFSPTFKVAMVTFCAHEEVAFDIFMKKIEMKAGAFTSRSSFEQYFQLFIDVYNYRNPNPIED